MNILNFTKLLKKKKQDYHNKYANDFNPLIIGGLLLLGYLFFFYSNYNLFFILIFSIGFLADLKILLSPYKRLFYQLLIISYFVTSQNFIILETRIFFIDKFLEYKIFNYIFVIFCFLVLINGSNFIDGLNGLLLGYYFLVLLFLIFMNYYFQAKIENLNYTFFAFVILLFFLNLFNLLFLGDGGAYLISFFVGIILVNFYNINNDFSPISALLLLWYPAFENLFTIIRRKFYNNSPTKPDIYHLHQLIFIFIYKYLSIFKKLYSNIVSSVLINLYNFFIFYFGLNYSRDSRVLSFIVLFNIIIYLNLYNLIKILLKNKKLIK
jgi:UDP-N-acetylmuramyl pentapeptide phosphotransferase/UDP-N-acetylglucosamine-1-phosphate transferase